jgi:hypothetical protein
MTRFGDTLRAVLEPVRDLHVAALLEALARELGRGGDVEAEPLERGADGLLRRTEPLNLPSRADLRSTRAGRTLHPRVEGGCGVAFDPVAGALDDLTWLRVTPFDWGAAEVRALRGPGGATWRPLRLWFLEWLQPRYGDESPDLLGAVHRLHGPWEEPLGWRFKVDFGSAPVAAFESMLEAFGRSGCAEIHVGETARAPSLPQ